MKYELCVCVSQHMSSIEHEIELMWTRNRSRRMTQFSNLFVIRTFATSSCDVFWFLYSFFSLFWSTLLIFISLSSCSSLQHVEHFTIIIYYHVSPDSAHVTTRRRERERPNVIERLKKRSCVAKDNETNASQVPASPLLPLFHSWHFDYGHNRNEFHEQIIINSPFCKTANVMLCVMWNSCVTSKPMMGTSRKHSFTFHLWIAIFLLPICHWLSSPIN